jgi:DNA-binding NarL/FixJ family response regulator
VIKLPCTRNTFPVCDGLEGLTEMNRTRILLADDDLPMLAATSKLLQAEFEVVGMVSDGHSLVEAAFTLQPDVIVTDISMPKMNGIEAVRKIRGTQSGIKCIFLTMHSGKAYRREAESLGAAGYVLKSSAREELNQAIHHALAKTPHNLIQGRNT